MIGRILTFLAAIGAIVLALALVVPFVINWEDQRGPLESRMGEAIGGPVTLGGVVRVRLLPTPQLVATNVDLADEAGRIAVEGTDMRAELDLWPLLARRVVVNRIVMAGGDVTLTGAAADLRALGDDLAARLSIGEGRRSRYLFAPSSLQWDTFRVESPRAEIWAEGEDTPVRIILAVGAARGDITLRPQDGGAWRVNARAAWAEEVLTARLDGTLESFSSGSDFTGELSLSADDLSALWGQERRLGFSMRGVVAANGANWTTMPMETTLGAARGTVTARVDTTHARFLNLNVQTSLADLDHMGAEMNAVRDGMLATIFGGAQTGLPEWLGADIRLQANGLVLNDRAIRDGEFEFGLEHGVLALGQGGASLPGNTTVSLGYQRSYSSFLSVRSENLRALLEWAGLDVSGVSGTTLQSFSLAAQLPQDGGAGVIIENMMLDGGQVRGSIIPDGAVYNVDLNLMGLNLDSYAALDRGDSALGRAGQMARTLLDDRLGTLHLTGEDVTIAGNLTDTFILNAQHTDGRLVIDEGAFGFASGGRLDIYGTWVPDGDIALRVSGEGVAPQLFDGLPLAPRELADIDITIERTGGVGTLEGEVLTEGLTVTLSGDESMGGDVTAHLGATADAPGALARALGLEEFATDAEGAPEQLFVDWTGTLEEGALAARLELPGLSVRAMGPITDALGTERSGRLDLGLSLRDAALAVEALGGPPLDGLSGTALFGEGELRLADNGWRFTAASLSLGDQSLLLDIGHGAGPTGILFGRVGLDHVAVAVPLAEDGQFADADAPRLAWSTSVFETDWIGDARLNLNVEIAQLSLGEVAFDEVSFRLNAAGGAVIVTEASARFEGGLVTGSGGVTVDGPALLLNADVAGEGLPAQTINALAGLPDMSGRLQLAAEVESRGRSPFDLVAGLAGRIDVNVTDGAFETIHMSRLANALDEVRTRRQLREAANMAMSEGRTPTARLGGGLGVARGVVDLAGLEGIAGTGAYSVAGSLDLRSQIVDVEATFVLNDKTVGNLPVLVAFRGAGGALHQSIDITELQNGIGARLTDTPEGLLSEEDLPEDLQELLRAYEEAFPEEASEESPSP